MKSAVACTALAIGIVAAASFLRLADLANRPMHCDEAVHGIKFGKLLEQADYVYDPREYHGPSLNYLTLPVAIGLGRSSIVDVMESDLRLVPAIAGIAIVALTWLLRFELGIPVALSAMVLTAVSTAMVFYSRYYIQEMLLVAFTFGAIVSLIRFQRVATIDEDSENKSNRWQLAGYSVACGICVGMMHASKETCVIALFSIAAAAACSFRNVRLNGRRTLAYCAIAAVVGSLVSAMCFSSFGRHPQGVWDSVTTYLHYLGRASGEGTAGRHVYPPGYYFEHLFWYQRFGGPFWTELVIGIPALAGMAAGITGKGLGSIDKSTSRFLAVYSLIMIAIYCAIPYKTPWCALGFFHPTILLAAIGVSVIMRSIPVAALRVVVCACLVLAAAQLTWQSWRASFEQYEHPGNPYVYSQTTGDIPKLVNRIEQFARSADASATHLQVICPDDDYWPLPWYLRRFTRVGWFHDVPDGRPGVLIITQPTLQSRLNRYLYVDQPPGRRHLYGSFPGFDDRREVYLRPHVPLRTYVRLDEWNKFEQGRP